MLPRMYLYGAMIFVAYKEFVFSISIYIDNDPITMFLEASKDHVTGYRSHFQSLNREYT